MEIEHFKIYKEFGPSILKVKIPENILKKLNEYVEKIILDQKKNVKLNLGEKLVGDVTQEFKLEKDFMQKSGWGIFLGTCVSKWIKIETSKELASKINKSEDWIISRTGVKERRISHIDVDLMGAKAAKIAEAGHQAALQILKPGVRENEICAVGTAGALQAGADFVRYFRVASDPEVATTMRWPQASNRVIQAGEIVIGNQNNIGTTEIL